MCRLFGFRSVIQSQVHTSLVHAENALVVQSSEHRDGWGVAYYVGESPHIVKSLATALDDQLFQRVSGIVASETVIAHLRRATIGDVTVLNTHPFQYGKWTFAHNGNIKNFTKYRDELMARVNPVLRRYILGDTDSELIFYLLLTHLSASVDLHRSGVAIDDLAEAVKLSVEEISSIVGPYCRKEGEKDETYLTFIITNGRTMLAHHGGKDLYHSTYKTKCSDRDTCPSFSPECEAVTKTGYINHLVFSSEPLKGENIWLPMKPGEVMGVDWRMKTHNST